MDDLELSTAELPATMRAWFDSQPAVVVSIEQRANDRVIVRPLPEIAPELLARIRVTMAHYREALMNLTKRIENEKLRIEKPMATGLFSFSMFNFQF